MATPRGGHPGGYPFPSDEDIKGAIFKIDKAAAADEFTSRSLWNPTWTHKRECLRFGSERAMETAAKALMTKSRKGSPYPKPDIYDDANTNICFCST